MHTVNSNIQQDKQHTSYSDQLKPLDYAGNLFFFFFPDIEYFLICESRAGWNLGLEA